MVNLFIGFLCGRKNDRKFARGERKFAIMELFGVVIIAIRTKKLFVKTFTKRFGNHLTRKKYIELKVLPQKQLL